jgi:hypothetical protein
MRAMKSDHRFGIVVYVLSQPAQYANRWPAHGNWAPSAIKSAAAPPCTFRGALP